VLFLDEMPEFPRGVLEVLRQPLEDGSITVARAAGVVTFPARFMLVGTLNPCPCGYAGDPNGRCRCEQSSITYYQRKLSGPLIDRIDLSVDVAATDHEAVIARRPAESSAIVAARVAAARIVQLDRLEHSEAYCNAHMTNKDVQIHCKIDNETQKTATYAMASLGLSARGFNRILKVARTIADLAGSPAICSEHFTEAMQYRPRIATAK
jgi:magnesium chelatase family protein